MATQYSNRQFFRKTPNKLLAKLFEPHQDQINIDFNELKETDSEAIQEALNLLPSEQMTQFVAIFQSIHALACEAGIIALIDEANFHNDASFVEAMAAIEGFHAKAIWAYLEKPNYWRGASIFLHADNVSASFWKKRNDLPKVPPHVEEKDIQALAKAISEYFYKKEGRGKNCIVEPYRRNNKEYFFAYPEDFAQSSIEWIDNNLQNQAHHPAFEIIFVYSESEGSLDIYAPKNPKALPHLQLMFAQNILKLGSLDDAQIDKRVYELAPVTDENFEFQFEPVSGIEKVLITAMRVNLIKGDKRRITLEADAYKDPDAVHNLLKELDLPDFMVTRLTFKVIFEPVGNQRAKTRTVNITYPNSCALGHDGNDLIIRQMLAKSGLEPKLA